MIRQFKEAPHSGVWAYLLQLRLAYVQWLLLSRQQKISTLALAAGFNSLTNFYAAFSRHTGGLSPRQYRIKNKHL